VEYSYEAPHYVLLLFSQAFMPTTATFIFCVPGTVYLYNRQVLIGDHLSMAYFVHAFLSWPSLYMYVYATQHSYYNLEKVHM
jgi:hypothetical protein